MTISINITEQFHQFDLDDKVICNEIADEIDINGYTQVVLDVSNCLIGYDATCKIIDKIIDELLALEGPKSLTVETDYQFPLEIVSSFLFRGSKYVSGSLGNQTITYEALVGALRDSLGKSGISISVTISGNKTTFL